MNKKAIAFIIGSALTVPSAFAAQDTSGMHYTSASEGFYASIRVLWSSNGSAQDDFGGRDGNGADIGGGFSRFGVRGTNDLGGGLEGFYQYEARFDHQQNEATKTRLANVGLRGNFGEVVVGTFWNNLYNFSYGGTDIANNYSGQFVSGTNSGRGPKPFPNRINSALQYTTPDLNGFQGSFLVVSDNQGADDGTAAIDATGHTCTGTAATATAAAVVTVAAVGATCGANSTVVTAGTAAVPAVARDKDDNDIDSWGLAAKYDIQGFSVGASYLVNADELSKANNSNADAKIWTVKVGYAQDNWYVNGWYGEDNAADDVDNADDNEYFSIAGGVSVDKVSLYAVYENQENGAVKDTFGTLGAQYNLGAQSRVFVEYHNIDQDTEANDEDSVVVGLRHDF